MKSDSRITDHASRPSQDTPEDLVARLLQTVRGQFCGDMTPGEWGMNSHFVKRNVILWPARFMIGKGFTLPAARYEAIMRSIFQTIIQHGNTRVVGYWPGYLMMCTQQHWRHHWEEYYAEAKAVRNQVAALLAGCQPTAREDRTVEALAMAHKVLASAKRGKGRSPAKQLGFQGL
jgi:hypothetical protein